LVKQVLVIILTKTALSSDECKDKTSERE